MGTTDMETYQLYFSLYFRKKDGKCERPTQVPKSLGTPLDKGDFRGYLLPQEVPKRYPRLPPSHLEMLKSKFGAHAVEQNLANDEKILYLCSWKMSSKKLNV
jgi:hypothetical protein